MGFKIRRRDIPPEKHPADMDSSREIDLVVKLSVLLWNDDMGSDQFKEVFSFATISWRIDSAFFEWKYRRPTMYFTERNDVSIPQRSS